MSGLFVTFEGVEGAGKTTQIELLAEWLQGHEHEVTITREPGGTPIGEAIRELLLSRKTTKLEPLTELLLFEADRAEHVATIVRPALDAGHVVVSDRFFDASTAYQGAARGVLHEDVEVLNALAAGGLRPDLTIVLDCDPGNIRSRIKQRFQTEGTDQARFEMERIEFHRAVRQGYLALAEQEPERFRVIPAEREIAEVFEDVRGAVHEALRAH